VSAILALADDEAFVLRVMQAVVARCMATPTETGEALLKRQRYNRLVLATSWRARGEAQRMLLPVLSNPSIQASFAGGGAAGIADGDIAYVIEATIAATLADSAPLRNPALAISTAAQQDVLQDIAGAIAAYVVFVLQAPELSASTTLGAQARLWAKRYAATPAALQETAARLASFILADTATLDELSLHGPDALSASVLQDAVARVLPALIPWDLMDAPTARVTERPS
jgi:uncharacterized protein YfiM (DUF2279 family)